MTKTSILHNEIQKETETSLLGFWIYMMTDCIVFATLFAVFIVLRNNTSGGKSGADLFSLPFVLTETIILLTSSFTSGLAMLAAQRSRLKDTLVWLLATGVLGAAFLSLELNEFSKFDRSGSSWRTSGFLSSYFTLVGTHGLHITIGLLWLLAIIGYLFKKGLNEVIVRRLTMFSIFWHFLDVVWIFIFTVVYLLGVN
jgi:cytochrome o ubiquinol oxidase subunit 3